MIVPYITEKSMHLASHGWYSFIVDIKDNKPKIKDAIEKEFKVTVVSVKTNLVKGKSKRTGKKRIEVAGSKWKKAVVSLKKGEKIDVFEFNEQAK